MAFGKATTLPMQKLVFRCETRCRWEKCGLRRGENDGDGDGGNPCAKRFVGFLRMEEGRKRKATWSGGGGTITFFAWAAAAVCASLIKPDSLAGGFFCRISIIARYRKRGRVLKLGYVKVVLDKY